MSYDKAIAMIEHDKDKRISELEKEKQRMLDVLWNISKAIFCYDAVEMARAELKKHYGSAIKDRI